MNNAVDYIYKQAKKFRRKYPLTITFRLKAHSKVLVKHLNDGEKIGYVFAAQKGHSSFDIFSTHIVAVTNRRIILARKRLLFGYFFTAITPDLFNDIKVKMGLVWAKLEIDTVKEFIVLSNIQRKAVAEIESRVTDYVMKEKKRIVKDINAAKEGSI